LYVITNWGLLVYLFYTYRYKITRLAMVGMIILSVITACLPQSYELRYYLYWMIVLISLNLYLLSEHSPLLGAQKEKLYTFTSLWHMIVLLVVLVGTKFIYIVPNFQSVDLTVQQPRLQPALQEQIKEGDNICLVREQPTSFLYASIFHPPKHYSIKAAESFSECDHRKKILMH
jgi:hypothetical protein